MSLPALTLVGPLYVLAPERVSVGAPILMMPPAPAITPAKVELAAALTGLTVKTCPLPKLIVPPEPPRFSMACAALLNVSVPPLTTRSQIEPQSAAPELTMTPPAVRVKVRLKVSTPARVRVALPDLV